MKRFLLPLLLVLIAACWLGVARDARARNGVVRAWNSPYASRFGTHTREFESQISQRFPTDPRERIDALAQAIRDFSRERRPGRAKERAWLRKIEADARGLPLDPPVLALFLRANLLALRSDRRNGPIFNRNFPAPPLKPIAPSYATSPRAEWNRELILAKRGQKLEPRNTFFRWMRIYGLLATRQDALARAELRLAARQTQYDDHNGDLILNRLDLMRGLYGEPLSPRDLDASLQIVAFPEANRIRTTAYWIMEGVILDRAAGRHRAALDTGFDLVRLGRTARLQSHFYESVSFGTGVQTIAMTFSLGFPKGVRFFPVEYRAPLKAYQASPFSLYRYAKSQNRADIASYVSGEWPQLATLNAVYFRHFRAPYERFRQGWLLVLAERGRSLLLRVLLSIAIFAAVFWVVFRRYRDDSGARKSGWALGGFFGLMALLLTLENDAVLILRPQNGAGPNLTRWVQPQGLLAFSPAWVWLAPACGVVLVALEMAANWQKHEVEPKLTFKLAVQGLLKPSADGLTSWDLGPLFGLIAMVTGVVLLTLAFNAPMMLFRPVFASLGAEQAFVANIITVTALGIVLGCLIRSWRRRPRRRATLHLAARLVFEALIAFALVLSLIYAALAFAPLSHARRVERSFESEMRRGPMPTARLEMRAASLQRQSGAPPKP